jgi:hypothetical protein
MDDKKTVLTRRDFLKGASCAALAATMGLPFTALAEDESPKLSRVVLIRDEKALTSAGKPNAPVIKEMIDSAVSRLFEVDKPSEAWKKIVGPTDIVGIKSNVWGPLPTPSEVEQAIEAGILSAGVEKENIAIDDRGVLRSEVFKNATALINVRPLRTHHWSGIGGCLKNPIMFTPTPWKYHDNSCADLGLVWKLPEVKGKVRLNILVLLTPHFYSVGPHNFDAKYTWPYRGLLVSTDPVANDAVGISLFNAKRKEYFERERPIKPPPHHVVFADTRHGLGVSDLNKIELVKLGWMENSYF